SRRSRRSPRAGGYAHDSQRAQEPDKERMMFTDSFFTTDQPLYAAHLHVLEPHLTLGHLCATIKSTHTEMWLAGDQVRWLDDAMAGKTCTALFSKQVAESYEELERASERVTLLSDALDKNR